MKQLWLSLFRKGGIPKYAKILWLMLSTTVDASMFLVGSNQENLVNESLTDKMYWNPLDGGDNGP